MGESKSSDAAESERSSEAEEPGAEGQPPEAAQGKSRIAWHQRSEDGMQLGMVGLGRMGGNMARRLMRGGHQVVAFDMSPDNVAKLSGEGAQGARSLQDFVSRLKPPRAAWVMVPAGDATEKTVMTLAEAMQAGDAIIDGGNSYFKDDVRRSKQLAARGIHYLDVGTSGLVIFARKASYVAAWAEALQASTGRKIYLAAARGRTPSKGAITRDLRDEGRLLPARTRYRWLGGAGGHSVLRVIPEHGRTHQIRRHLAAIGHPILGDERYGHAPTNRFFEEKHGLDRTFLHCIRLELNHPRTGARLIVELHRAAGAAQTRTPGGTL